MNPLAGIEADADLLEQATQWVEHRDFRVDAAVLRALMVEQGIDFATAAFYAAVTRVPANVEFATAVTTASVDATSAPDLVALVPGAFYREHTNTGADGSRVLGIARELGWPVATVPIASFGPVDDNAATIVRWLLQCPERQIALISLSKGGAEVKRALSHAQARDAFAKVTAWISFSGIVQGTPLIGWLRARPLRWWGVHVALWCRGHRTRALLDLQHGAAAPLTPWPDVPPHLRIVHVCGVPLRGHLRHPWAARGYERLAPLGPNDGGGILLGDMAGLPGIVFPVWGADHYLEPAWDPASLFRNVVIAALSRVARSQAIRSAISPNAAPANTSIA